ncbi:MAG: vanadium-dependent haloperoxidase [Gemmatimonadaceae bacterium]
MRNRRLPTALLVAASITLVTACTSAHGDYRTDPPDAELLHEAVANLTNVIVYDIFNPPQAARAYSYASVAAYEALRHGDSTFRTFAGQLNGLSPVPAPAADSEYYLPLAGVHAFMTVGKALTFSQGRMDSLRSVMHERIRRMRVPDDVFARSVAYGDEVAEHILAWSKQDNYLQTRGYAKYTVTEAPGRWVPTPPGYMDAVEPHWSKIRPFALDSASQFRPEPPYAFDMNPGSAFFREVKEVYDVTVHLTDEQRAIAAFWDCNPYVMNVRGHAMFATKKITPGGHWMGIAAIAARKASASLVQSAATYARTAIALHDGFISSWDEKFRSNVVRPETAINAHLDPSWQPLLQTPPFPEYTSGHSVISTAAAAVLTDEFGDNFAFADSTELTYGLPVRSFPSFNAAADEAAMSRLYGGIHYRMAIEEGVVQGRKVGEFVVREARVRASAQAGQIATTGRQ